MKKISKRLSSKTGLAPGALIHVGPQRVKQTQVHHYWFNEQEFEFNPYKNEDLDSIHPLEKNKIHWFHIVGTDVEVVKTIGQQFNIHTLILEDILNSHLRPKYENHEAYCFLSLKYFSSGEQNEEFESFPVNLLMGTNYVISFLGTQEPVFNALNQRIKNPEGKIRKKGSDYLFFALADIIVDSYFHPLEKGNDILEELENQIDNNNTKDISGQIQNYKKSLIKTRRSILPLKEAYFSILKEEGALFDEENQKYFRDTQDHILFAIDQLEYLKEYLNSLRDAYQSNQDKQLNQIMKLLTLIATLFIPLTFLAGIYGMNFEYIPELKWKYGYFGLLSLMAAISVIMLWFFKKKKWL